MLPQRLTNVLTILISLVWTANVVVGFINPGLRDPLINAIFAVVVGTVYALGRRSTPADGDNVVQNARRRLGDLIAGDNTEPGDGTVPADTSREGDQR
ncbi:hypothetical protein [Lentzea kentuckyensis]|uniref:hypothetical protein n=1 Tax=Lentzea kentuckyensis TaxID=360086 RepID=UPI000A3B9A7D|nr:hypothetical protein [Lentzea kentuckyensis]